MSSYSKGSRGLSVLPRVHCIFTASSISLSLGWRQPGHHYAIRAGRNSPDKEFRYLRTVIVTAGVHPRFSSTREGLPLTFGHWPGISPYTSACALAGTCVFGKQSLEVFRCGPAYAGQALSRGYGRCFAEFLKEGSLVHLRILSSPTCVGLRYRYYYLSSRGFSW